MKHITLASAVLLSLLSHSALAAEQADVTSRDAINKTEVQMKGERGKAHGHAHQHQHNMPSRAERSDYRKKYSKEYRHQRLQSMSHEERREHRKKWRQKKTSHSIQHNLMKEMRAIDAHHPEVDNYFKDMKLERAEKKEVKLLFMQAHRDYRKAIRKAFLEMSPEERTEAKERWKERKADKR